MESLSKTSSSHCSEEEEKSTKSSDTLTLYEHGDYLIRYPQSVEELLLAQEYKEEKHLDEEMRARCDALTKASPLETIIDSLMDDPTAIIFGVPREVVSDMQYSNIEGYIESDTMLLVVHKPSGLICGAFLLVHRNSKISALTPKVYETLMSQGNVRAMMQITTSTITERAKQTKPESFSLNQGLACSMTVF